MRIVARLLLAAALLATSAACTINPATGEKSFTAFMSPADEERVGAEQHSQLVAQMGGAYGDVDLGAYVERVGQSVAGQTERPDGGYVFTVVNDHSVNAFALPGGYVYVTRGLLALAGNDAELAGVIAHELGHVVARHAAQRYSRTVAAGVGVSALSVLGTVFGVPPMAGDLAGYGAQAYLQGYSRDQEMEADRLAVRYMTRAGYDPNAMVTFFRKLDAQTRLQTALAGSGDTAERFDIMASHPRTADRLQQASGLVPQSAASPASPAFKRLGEDDYLSRIDGLVYGDAVEDGVRRGQDFIHPGLKIAFRVPPRFVLQNAPQQVVAVGPDRSVIVFSGASGDTSRGEPMSSYLTRVWASRAKLTNVEALTVDGLDAATGVTRATTKDGPTDVRVVAIRAPDRIYQFLFLSSPEQTAQLSGPFKDTLSSFRRLSEAEAAAIRPLRVRIVTVRSGDTVQSLAARMPFPGYAADLFLVLNALDGGVDALPAGRRVKVVSDGSGGSPAG